MIPTLRELVALIAGAGLMLAIALLAYEGIPLGPLRLIPFVGPALEYVTDGRVDRVRKEGAAQERILWEEARRRLQAQIAEDRRKAQAKIDELRVDYVNAKSADAATIAILREQAKEFEIDETSAPRPGNPTAARRLSRTLNKIGR